MARAPKKTTDIVGDFMKDAPQIWNVAVFSSLLPYARLSSDVVISAMRDKSADITGGSKFTELSGQSALINAVESTLTSAWNGRDKLHKNVRIKKDGKNYRFNLIHRESAVLMLDEMTLSIPGSVDILNQNSAATDAEVFAPIFEGLKEAGLDLGENPAFNQTIRVPFTKIETEDTYNPPSGNPNTHMILTKGLPKDFKLSTPAYKIECGATVIIKNVPGMRQIDIDPYVDLIIHEDVFQAISESDTAESKAFLAVSWMQQAIHNGLFNRAINKWSAQPYTDLRITSKQLQDVVRNHGKAPPRVNKDNIAISELGLPIYIPATGTNSGFVDNCDAYMKDMGKPLVEEDGYMSFDSALETWANKIILTDWFNDILVYTDVNGELEVYRMHGFVALDKNSEYVFMQTPLTDSEVVGGMLNLAQGLAGALVSPEEATEYLSPSMRTKESYNEGKVTMGLSGLFMTLRNNTAGKLTNSDSTFIRDNQYSLSIKHLLGQDLEEVPSMLRPLCAHAHAYLKALAAKRKDIDAPVMSRLVGFEWLLIAAKNADNDYPKIKEESISKRALLKQQPLLDTVDIPNIDAGGNFLGLLPHQLRVLSNRFAGESNGSMAADAGGGKTVMILADILKKKLDNPSWKPFILTKGRLVPGFISEINYFCKGKVNVMSLSVRMIRELKQKMKIDTAEKFLKYIRSLPPNTIFISGYTSIRSRSKFFTDLKMPTRVFDTDIALPQMVHLLRLIGFEMVRCDESHMIKNMKSQQARISHTMLAQSREKVIASGTQTHNTVVDMVGQAFGLNPMIFGKSPDNFKKRYNMASGLVDLENAQVMKRRINKFVQENVASKEDWSFLLPDLVDKTLVGQMTPFQSIFYFKLLERALVQLRMLKEGKSEKEVFKGEEEEKKNAPTPDGEDEDDDDTDDEEDEGDEEDDVMDGISTQALDRSLSKVESFVAAPDENEEYIRLDPRPSPTDLISPMVGLIDAQFDKIYADPTAEHWNNKSAVFGINKAASRHFMRHSRWASKALHYTAGNEEVIRRFKTEPQSWILVADSTSLREGENLQMLSHIFELQCMWSPGDFEQLVSRMYRPDPKGVYNKEKIFHYWCVNRQTNGAPDVNSLKLARMTSKAISLAQYRYSDDPRWKLVAKSFEDLDLLKMSFEFIRDARQVDIEPYYYAWNGFVSWQIGLNQKNREKFAEELEASNPGIKLLDGNGKVLDRKMFTQLAMKPVISTKDIPGSKKAYVPWERGAVPADTENLGLVLLGSQNAAIGDYVMTEFGPAIVQEVSRYKLMVELHGLRKVRVSRRSTAIALDPKGKEKLAEIIRNPAVWKSLTLGPVDTFAKLDPSNSLAPKGSAKARITKPAPVVQPPEMPKIPEKEVLDNPKVQNPKVPPKTIKPPLVKKEEKPQGKPIVEEFYAYLFNGYPCLVILDPPSKLKDLGWTFVPDYVTVRFKNWNVATNLIDAIARKFYMSKNDYEELLDEMNTIKTGSAVKLSKPIKESEARNFFLQNAKSPQEKGGKAVVRPFWVAIGTDRGSEVRLAFSKKSHSAEVIRWLKTMQTKNPGNIKGVAMQPGFALRMFNSLNEAANEIQNVGEYFDIPSSEIRQELRELREEIQQLKAPKKTPDASVKKEVVKEEPKVKKPVQVKQPAPKTVGKKPASKPGVKTPVKKPVKKPTRR